MAEEKTLAELQHELEEIKRAQSGSDRRVRELTEENKQLQEKLESAKDDQGRTAALIDRKQKIWEMASEKGQDPKLAMTLIFGEDDEEVLDSLAERETEIRLEERDKFAKKHGRKPLDTPLDGALTYDEILKMPTDQVNRLSPDVINTAIERAASVDGRSSLRSKLEGML